MGDLIRAMAQMQQQLKQTIGEINLSSSQLASTPEELSAVTEQSSRTLHQQSQEMELAATAVTELTTAIEAARAGDSGRGFAVVADEVRALAHRTQESAKEIERMMQTVQTETLHTVDTMKSSSRRAINTVTVAQKAGDALQQITVDIAQISEQNLTIASAVEEQATVTREVDSNLVNIRDFSLQTATGAHETQASSAELARLAEFLNQLVTQLKV